nr:immunoglobulin light chain junction region [Macaca mulatta]
CQQHISYPRTF